MVKYALRSLLKTPGFTAIAVLTLAVGIGANTAIFSVIYGVLLRPLPFEEPSRIVSLWELSPDDAGQMHRSRTTAGNYADWESESSSFQEMAVFGAAGVNWTGDGEPEQLLGARVSASYFPVLGIEPVLGRTFRPEENVPGNNAVLLLSHGLWQRRFGGSSDVLGKILTLDGSPYEIIGVMPKAVYPTWPQATGRVPFLPSYQQMWVPMALSEPFASNRTSHLFGVIARLGDGVTLETARAEMATIARRLEQAHPEANAGETILVVPYLDEVAGGARPALWILLAAVGLVLLGACANIAGLVLARSAARRRELALRAALGASRATLLRHFLSESLLLGVLGGLVGAALAFFAIDVLIYISPAEIPRLSESGLSLPVLGFALLVSLLTGLGLGLPPALSTSRPDLQSSLKEGVRSTPERFGLSNLLVVSEVALAVVLVVAAGLLLQSFRRINEVDLGFDAGNVLLAELALPRSSYPDFQSVARMHRSVLEEVTSLPGVADAALTYDHPLESNWIDSFRLVGEAETDESLAATLRIVSPDYFRTLGIDIRAGRPLTDLDDAEHPGAVIVNEAFVQRYLNEAEPLGRALYTSTPRYVGESLPETFAIVGVVENVRFLGPTTDPEPAFYLPASQFPVNEMVIALRADESLDPMALASGLRDALWSLDPDLPVSNVSTMERHRMEALAQPRFVAIVLAFFGFAALALAAMGLYGLLSYTVTQRVGEIGIRMALGARAEDVTRMVLGQGMRLTLVGLSVGLVAALFGSRVLGGLLFGVATTDAATLAGTVAFLVVVSVLASYLPASRAARVEPLKALRET